VLLTGEEGSHYQDYAADPGGHLARALASGFAFQGEVSAHRGGRPRGEPSRLLSPLAFVNFLQNHDQIGNRPLGERLVALVAEAPVTAALAITLLAPMPPLLFMGEEWGARTPFPFFCDFPEPLATAVRKGRRAEFKDAYAALGERIPDPLAESTFRAAVLDWDTRHSPAGRLRLGLVRELLALRQREIAPYLAAASFGAAQYRDRLLQAHWRLAGGHALLLVANLSDRPALAPPQARTGRPIWGAEHAGKLAAWAVLWRIGAD